MHQFKSRVLAHTMLAIHMFVGITILEHIVTYHNSSAVGDDVIRPSHPRYYL